MAHPVDWFIAAKSDVFRKQTLLSISIMIPFTEQSMVALCKSGMLMP